MYGGCHLASHQSLCVCRLQVFFKMLCVRYCCRGHIVSVPLMHVMPTGRTSAVFHSLSLSMPCSLSLSAFILVTTPLSNFFAACTFGTDPNQWDSRSRFVFYTICLFGTIQSAIPSFAFPPFQQKLKSKVPILDLTSPRLQGGQMPQDGSKLNFGCRLIGAGGKIIKGAHENDRGSTYWNVYSSTGFRSSTC